MPIATPALQIFMTKLIDYAGLFPPAKLPLAEAWSNYQQYRQQPEQWMLGRFIIPARQLAELGHLINESPLNPPVGLAILGRGGATKAEFLDGLEADILAMTMFRRQHRHQATAEVLEVRLPESPINEDFLRKIIIDLSVTDFFIPQFYELPPSPEWLKTLPLTVELINQANKRYTYMPDSGLKLRCGGIEAAAFPSIEQVAATVEACHQARIPLKATAGLHHPLRHFDTQLQTFQHGFLNLFAAAILAQVHALRPTDLAAILRDEEASHFVFTSDSFSWQGLSVTLPQLDQARRYAAISYGSCSFDEPYQDLRVMNYEL